jgi:hypothetical protein
MNTTKKYRVYLFCENNTDTKHDPISGNSVACRDFDTLAQAHEHGLRHVGREIDIALVPSVVTSYLVGEWCSNCLAWIADGKHY